jgi:hypothetical protein
MVHLVSFSDAILGKKLQDVSDGHHLEPGIEAWSVISITFAGR